MKGFNVYLTAREVSLIHEAIDMLESDWECEHPESEELSNLITKLCKAHNKANGE